jgi:hypothetical protein
MKRIVLTQGYSATVDDADYKALAAYCWMALVNERGYVYAVTRMPETGRKLIRMHRFICGLVPGDVREVDHRNGDTLDYRRSNLRVCTKTQNLRNRRKTMRSTSSRYKGVVRVRNVWRARLQFQWRGKRKSLYLGSFVSEEAAARAYDAAIGMRHGEFARPNFR